MLCLAKTLNFCIIFSVKLAGPSQIAKFSGIAAQQMTSEHRSPSWIRWDGTPHSQATAYALTFVHNRSAELHRTWRRVDHWTPDFAWRESLSCIMGYAAAVCWLPHENKAEPIQHGSQVRLVGCFRSTRSSFNTGSCV